MHKAVRDAFFAFSVSFESLVRWLYLDVKGFVTVGVGNLVDPPALLGGLTFLRKDGSIATASEVHAAWLTVKNLQKHAKEGGGSKTFENATSLRVDPASIQRLVMAKLSANEVILKQTFPCWESWPACAQEAALSMTWAYGAAFTKTWPKFTWACLAHNWELAALECRASKKELARQNPSFKKRNATQVALFYHAAQGGDPEVLMSIEDALIEAVNTGRVTATLHDVVLSPEEHEERVDDPEIVYSLPN
jgi:GH24 family phage-related lysozyme (muramidase)